MKKIIVLSIILSLFSCKEVNKERPSIQFLHYFTESLSSGIDKLADTVNSNQKEFNLIATPMDHEEFKISIRTQLESQYPPDLFTYWAGSRTKYLVEHGQISPISDLFKTLVDPSVFDKSVLDACSYNSEIYMLPITRHYVGFFYNKNLFNKYNIDPPQNWDGLLEVADILKNKGVAAFALGAKNRWPAQFWFDFIMLRTAGFTYREKLMNNGGKYNDPEVLKTMEIWKELLGKGFFGNNMLEDDWDDAVVKVSTGEVAMTLMGTWTIPVLEREGQEPNVDYGFFRFPVIDPSIDIASLGPIDGVLLSSGSKKHGLSKEVLVAFTKAGAQESFNRDSGAIAPLVNVNDNIYNPIQLQIKEYISQSKNWAFNYDLAASPVVSEAGLDFFVDFLDNPEQYPELLESLEVFRSENTK
ncbi:MAG: ABC transporter substrate-binding protein [Spirochaetaceae bacterium]